MVRRTLGLFALVVTLAVGCTRNGGAPSDAERPTAAPTTTTATTGTATATAPAPTGDGASCAGLAPTACVLRAGCFLDQPTAGKLVCRAAKDACERAVRHADVIGTMVPGVTEAEAETAERTCAATAGCAVAGGKCSCPCAIFGHCNCACGGGYLRRCTTEAAARTLPDFPPRP